MKRSLMFIIVLFGFIQSLNQSISSPSHQGFDYKVYLPMASYNPYPNVDIVPIGLYEGYLKKCVVGYLINNTETPIYSVSLAIDVTRHNYCPPDWNCLPTYETGYVKTELEATLPGQKNPFSYCVMHYKVKYEINAVRLAIGTFIPPNGREYYPLSVMSWSKESTTEGSLVSGSIRNDSGHRLTEIRVVGLPCICPALEAQVWLTILDPGEETSFIFDKFNCYDDLLGLPIDSEMVELSAQGVTVP